MPSTSLLLGGVVALVITAVASFLYGQHVENLSWEAAVGKQKVEAANVLVDATNKVRDAEAAREDTKNKLELQHVETEKTITDEKVRNQELARQLAVVLDGVRNKGRGPSGRSANGAANPAACSCTDLATANDKLSRSVERLASAGNDIAASADTLVNTLTVCKAWAENPKE